MKLGGQASVQELFLFKLYLIENKEYIFSVSYIVFLNSEGDESVRELLNSMFLIKCGKSNSLYAFFMLM